MCRRHRHRCNTNLRPAAMSRTWLTNPLAARALQSAGKAVVADPTGTHTAGVDDFQYLFLGNAETARQAQGFAHHDGVGYREKVAHDLGRGPGAERADMKQILG